MLKYKILSSIQIKELEIKVNKAIEEGWEPLGGIDSNVAEGQEEYLQAMIDNKNQEVDFKRYLDQKTKELREHMQAYSDQLTLGDLIKKFAEIIERYNDSTEVFYDFAGFYPTNLDSWRGAYNELALNYVSRKENREEPLTIVEFFDLLKSAVGTNFTGYKGGEYTMLVNTPVWVSNYGESYQTAVVGVIEDENLIILATAHRDY